LALRGIGSTLAEFGQYDKALRTFDESLALLPELKNDRQRLGAQLETYRGFAVCYIELGQYDKAFDYSERGLKIAREIKNDYSQQYILTDIGVAHLRLGSLHKAEAYLISAAELSRKLKSRQVIALGTANLGAVYSRLKQYDKAMTLFEEALPQLRELKMHRLVVIFSYYYGMVRRERGEIDRAVALHREAIELARTTQTPKYEARALCELGLDYLAQGNLDLARAQFTRALSIARQVRARDEEAAALSGLMRTWERSGEHMLAIFVGKQAVNLFQSTRNEIIKVDRRMQADFVQDNEPTYRKLVEIMVAAGRISEAEQILAMLKDEEVFSYLRRDDKVARELLQTISLTEREREALKRYDELADKITAIGKEFGELDAERKSYAEGQFLKQARLDELNAQLRDATNAFQKFLDGLKVKFGEADRRVAAVDSGLQSALKRLKAGRTVIASTIVGKDRLNIIVTTADTQRAHTVDVSEKEVNQLVADFRQALINPTLDPRPAGQKLYDILVRPIEADLAGVEADTIAWSLDGTLRYIPTAAIWDRQRGYLTERFASVVLTLASSRTIELPVSDRENWSALGVGVSKPVEGFSALTAVPDELDCIITDAQAKTVSLRPICQNGVMTGRKLLDEKFTLTAFENSLGRFPVVHIASHFSLNPGQDKDSFMLLGGGDQKRFTVENLRGVSLADVELIVLSACNTATPGGAAANGVEVEGFGAVAQKQGAKAVLATLWSVADGSTRDLMVKFYRVYGEKHLTKAEALRRAQLPMIHGKYQPSDGNTTRGLEVTGAVSKNNPRAAFRKDDDAPLSHPYYWSPFILIGNWK
jgi:CHAT domain-containing protein/Tfp pilus assembly protein PilF